MFFQKKTKKHFTGRGGWRLAKKEEASYSRPVVSEGERSVLPPRGQRLFTLHPERLEQEMEPVSSSWLPRMTEDIYRSETKQRGADQRVSAPGYQAADKHMCLYVPSLSRGEESPCWSTHTADWQECLEFRNTPYVYKLSCELLSRNISDIFREDKNAATIGRAAWKHLALQSTRAEPPTGRVLTDCELGMEIEMEK